jgi:PadR family transcriptional regulator PadR
LDDINAADTKFLKELNAGIAALVLLGVMDRAGEPIYGYRIAKIVESSKETASMIKQGALYPVLRSLENSGLLSSKVEPSVSGPPRRYYKITDHGRQTFKRWMEIWSDTKAFVDSALKGVNHD